MAILGLIVAMSVKDRIIREIGAVVAPITMVAVPSDRADEEEQLQVANAED